MKKHWIVIVVSAMGVFFGAVQAAAQGSQSADKSHPQHWYSPARYNPVKLIKKDSRTASERLAANHQQDRKLTTQLQTQGVLPPKTDLKEACSAFKSVEDCVAALHVSHNLKVKFNCVKWDMTAVKPGGASACSAPASGRPMSLGKTIRVLKPDADARAEEKTARKQAHDDIADASS